MMNVLPDFQLGVSQSSLFFRPPPYRLSCKNTWAQPFEVRSVEISPPIERGHPASSLEMIDISESVDFTAVRVCNSNMWQSRVEFEGYSVTYFDRIGAFEVSYR